jgi:ferrous iron transport protein B
MSRRSPQRRRGPSGRASGPALAQQRDMLIVETESQSRLARVLLVGNANVGKSAIFFALTGRYVTVSNYPGTTVELTHGACGLPSGARVDLVDTPGTATLEALSQDEEVACRVLRDAERETSAALVVLDARNLRRGLALALEVAATGLPLVLAVNMIDEARAAGVAIDAGRLAALFGVPVALTAATRGEGIEALRAALEEARPARLAPPGGETIGDRLARAASLRDAVVRRSETRGTAGRFAGAFGRAATHRVFGLPILAGVLFLSWLFVGKLGAGVAVDFLQGTVFGAADGPGLNGILARAAAALGAPAFARDLLFGPYGLVTMAVTYALALVLPIVAFFFLVFGFLEDTGYMPRLAVVTNRAFSAIGLNGKAVLPMVLGLGCDTMATLATRILPTRRERLIVALLLALAVPCSAQLAVIFGLFALAGGPRMLAVWGGVVLAVLAAVGWLAGRLLPGDASDFIVELPPIRRPSAANIARKTLARVEWYLREAVPLFVLGTLLLFALDRLALLDRLARGLEPLVTGVLGLPRDCAAAFVVGFLRRDYGAIYLFDAARTGALTPAQVVVAAVTITLFLPCVASYFMLVREFGAKTSAWVAGLVVAIAFGAGGALHALMSAWG